MDASIKYYVDGLGCRRTNQWIVDGKIRWCWLEFGNASLMLQELNEKKVFSDGVSVCFQCQDAIALYKEFTSRGIKATKPVVGNFQWEVFLEDQDGHRLAFGSPTDLPEETEWDGQA